MATEKSKRKRRCPGFCALQSAYWSLRRWRQNPRAPRRSYGYLAWQTDDPVNDQPASAEAIKRWKRMLREFAPRAYRQLERETAV
jgi:hypothetical protein